MNERLTSKERENTRALARAWLETPKTDPLHGIGLLLNSLLDERDAAVADLEEVTQERDEKHYIPQDLTRNMRVMLLHFLWPGMENTPPGVPTTFINLVQDVIDRAKKAEQHVADLNMECEQSLRAAEVSHDLAEKSIKTLADFVCQTSEERETNLRRLNTNLTDDELVKLEQLCEAASPGQISKPMSNGAVIDASGVLVMRIVYASDAVRERLITAYNVLPRLIAMVRGTRT